MAWFATLALILWPAVVFVLFEKLAVPRAIVASFVTAWLFLPPTQIPLAGFPDWSKTTATVVSVIVCCWLKQPARLFGVRPRWYDLPVVAYCLIPMASALRNGVGVYDGLSACLEEIVRWGLPYLIGRAYLASAAGNWSLCLGMAMGGMAYAPLCLVEIRMSPQLKTWLYGFGSGRAVDFGLRYGGYRPMVFLSTGLELGWWMCCASLAAFMLWRSGSVRQIWGYPMWALTLMLGVVTVACKATGALVQVAIGFALIYGCRAIKRPYLVWGLILISPCYCVARPLGLWSGESIVAWSDAIFGADRAESLQFRFLNEEVLFQSANQRPTVGWGRGGGFNPPDESGKTAITDGLWIIVYGWMGGAGLAALNGMLLVPTVLFLARYRPRTWFDPDVAPLAALAMILPLFMLDNLSNAMLNPIYAIAMGSVAGCLPAARAAAGAVRDDQVASGLLAAEAAGAGEDRPGRGGGSPRDATADRLDEQASTALAGGDLEAASSLLARAIAARQSALDVGRTGRRMDRLARAHVALARVLAAAGDREAAIVERERALAVWRALGEAEGLGDGSLGAHAANLNDLAWRLVEGRTRDPSRLDRAVLLAEEALHIDPDQASFWNTLGVARYRRGDHHKAIHALSQAVDRSPEGGNAFDYYHLALANHALGYPGPAARWIDRAEDWSRARPDWGPMLREVRDEVGRAVRARPVG